jgi:hypothetical protein
LDAAGMNPALTISYIKACRVEPIFLGPRKMIQWAK